jgi:hypothetical protein
MIIFLMGSKAGAAHMGRLREMQARIRTAQETGFQRVDELEDLFDVFHEEKLLDPSRSKLETTAGERSCH